MGRVWGEEWHVYVFGRLPLRWGGLRSDSIVEKMRRWRELVQGYDARTASSEAFEGEEGRGRPGKASARIQASARACNIKKTYRLKI